MDQVGWRVGSRGELCDIEFYIENGRAIDGVELTDENMEAVDALDFAAGDADAIGAVFRALGEDADERIVGAVARVTRRGEDFFGSDAVKNEDDFQVREVVEATSAFRSELGGVEDDFADEVGSAIVGGSFDFGFDDADLTDREFGRR